MDIELLLSYEILYTIENKKKKKCCLTKVSQRSSNTNDIMDQDNNIKYLKNDLGEWGKKDKKTIL